LFSEFRVPHLQKFAIGAAVAALLGVLAYTELVLDWRTPDANQKINFALTSNSAFLMADYNRLQAEMKQKYGERVSVSVPVTGSPANKTGVAEISLDGSILETRSLRRLSDVYGLFVANADGSDPIRFPFRLGPDQNLENLDRSIVKDLTQHFKRVPQAWFEFTDADWTIDRCSSAKSGLGLGIVGDVLRLQEGTSCVVSWKGKQPSSMLVFVGRADGEAWLRPFSERLCRNISEAGLQRLDSETAGGLNYAACVLGNQATNSGSGKSLFGTVYAVRHDFGFERLARIGKL
jgi:hypothetical protein